MSRYCPSCGKPCSQSGCVCGWASQQERPPIYPDEQGDWAASNRGYERRIREWVSQVVHLQSHHVAYVLSQLDTVRERAEKAEQQLASLAAAQERMTEALTVIEQWRWISVLCGGCGYRYRYCRWCGVGSPDSVGSGEEQCGGHPATPCRSNCRVAALPSLAASSRETTDETKDDARQSSPSPVRTTGISTFTEEK